MQAVACSSPSWGRQAWRRADGAAKHMPAPHAVLRPAVAALALPRSTGSPQQQQQKPGADRLGMPACGRHIRRQLARSSNTQEPGATSTASSSGSAFLATSCRMAWARALETTRTPAPEPQEAEPAAEGQAQGSSASSAASTTPAANAQAGMDGILHDPHAAMLANACGTQEGTISADTPMPVTALMDVLSTVYCDAQLESALNAASLNTLAKGDYRQVVLLGDGFDTRPFRFPWPPGTLIFMVAPPEAHERAEAVLAAAGAKVPRGCLLRRVNAQLLSPGWQSSQEVELPSFLPELEKAGYQGDKLSVWVLQGLAGAMESELASHSSQGHASTAQGLSEQQAAACAQALRQVLAEVANAAAYHSLVMGELPSLGAQAGLNLLAEAGLLASVVPCSHPAVDFGGRLAAQLQAQGLAGGHGSSGEGAGAGAGQRLLFCSQQQRMSLAQMDTYDSHVAALDFDEDYTDNIT